MNNNNIYYKNCCLFSVLFSYLICVFLPKGFKLVLRMFYYCHPLFSSSSYLSSPHHPPTYHPLILLHLITPSSSSLSTPLPHPPYHPLLLLLLLIIPSSSSLSPPLPHPPYHPLLFLILIIPSSSSSLSSSLLYFILP